MEAAKTVNSGHQTSPALQQLMTAGFAKTMNNILGPDVGLYYPGPLPLQPIGVTVLNASSREIRGCGMTQGFTTRSKNSSTPAQARRITPVHVFVVRQSGRWLVDNLTSAKDVNCKHVEVKTPRW